MSTIAFIGLGAMGGPMALNLMAAGQATPDKLIDCCTTASAMCRVADPSAAPD